MPKTSYREKLKNLSDTLVIIQRPTVILDAIKCPPIIDRGLSEHDSYSIAQRTFRDGVEAC